MSKKKALAVIGLGAAGYAVFRAVRSVEKAGGAYQRRGPRWDVIVAAAAALVALVAAIEQAEGAVKRAKRAF